MLFCGAEQNFLLKISKTDKKAILLQRKIIYCLFIFQLKSIFITLFII